MTGSDWRKVQRMTQSLLKQSPWLRQIGRVAGRCATIDPLVDEIFLGAALIRTGYPAIFEQPVIKRQHDFPTIGVNVFEFFSIKQRFFNTHNSFTCPVVPKR